MSYFVYILRSRSAEKYYVGSTQDINRRLELHNGPRARWTKRYQPWEVVYDEEFETRGDALRREHELKRLKGIAAHLESIWAGRE